MDFLIEFLVELAAEGTVELSKSIKVPKFIRYLLIAIIVSVYVGITGIVFFAAFASIQHNLFFGIILIAIALLMLIMGIVKFRKIYIARKNIK